LVAVFAAGALRSSSDEDEEEDNVKDEERAC